MSLSGRERKLQQAGRQCRARRRAQVRGGRLQAGSSSFDVDIAIAPLIAGIASCNTNSKTIQFDGRIFSLKGDSGSLVVDNQGQSVGLLDAGGMKAFDTVCKGVDYLPIGITVAQFIVPALAHPSYAAFRRPPRRPGRFPG
jgi:hypothetical protein